jgi:TolB-like protein
MPALLFFNCSIPQQTIPEMQTSQIKPIVQENNYITPDKSLNTQLDKLTDQIVNSMISEDKTKVAVIEFPDLRGNVSEFGQYISEELITRLFITRKFEVIERRLLNKVLDEQKLSVSDLIDPNSIKELGKLLGVDAIVTGTVTDLGTNLKINARIISTETGAVFAVASTEILKDESVIKLLNRFSVTQKLEEKELQKIEERPVEKKVIRSGEVFFKEDFFKYDEGDPVLDWGNDLMVKRGRDGIKYLTSIVPGTHLAEQYVNFPKNFQFEYTWSSYDDRNSGRVAPYVKVLLKFYDEKGKMFKVECGNWGVELPGLPVKDFDESGINRFKLTKMGDVIKVYNNGAFLLSGVYPGYSKFVKFDIIVPVKGNGEGQLFTNFIGTGLGE